MVDAMKSIKFRQNMLKMLKYIKNFKDITSDTDNKYDFYDYKEFNKLSLFNQIEQENVDQKIDFHLKFIKMESCSKSAIKALDDEQNKMFQNFMCNFHILSDEIRAISSVLIFIELWKDKLIKGFELTEYPIEFIRCFDKIPTCEQVKLRTELADIKPLPGNERKLQELNKFQNLNQMEMLLVNQESPSIDSVMRDKIEPKRIQLLHGTSQKVDISVLDFTIANSNSGYSPTGLHMAPNEDESIHWTGLVDDSWAKSEKDQEEGKRDLNEGVCDISEPDGDKIGTILLDSPKLFAYKGGDSNEAALDNCSLSLSVSSAAGGSESIQFDINTILPMAITSCDRFLVKSSVEEK